MIYDKTWIQNHFVFFHMSIREKAQSQAILQIINNIRLYSWNCLIVSRTTILECLTRISLQGEELVVTNLSTFTELLQSKNSRLEQILSQSVNKLGINNTSTSANIFQLIRCGFYISQDLTDDSVGFSSTPQVQVRLSDSSVVISGFFKCDILPTKFKLLALIWRTTDLLSAYPLGKLASYKD